jgi:hypothetical protein
LKLPLIGIADSLNSNSFISFNISGIFIMQDTFVYKLTTFYILRKSTFPPRHKSKFLHFSVPRKRPYWKYIISRQRYLIRVVVFSSWLIMEQFINLLFFCNFSELNANDPKSKFVQLEKNIAQNLTCVRGFQGNRIQWSKVNCFIHLELIL